MIGLVGSVPTGRAVMKLAAERLKPVLLELGGVCSGATPAACPRSCTAGRAVTLWPVT